MHFNRILGVIFALLVGIVLAVPEFTEEFDVTNAGPREYRQFLERLRNLVRDPANGSHNIPLCLPQVDPPTRFFELVLRAGGQAIRLWIRRDNLFIIGFRNEAGNQWFEIERTGTQTTIPGAQNLGFTGDYGALQGAAKVRRATLNLGQDALMNAIQALPTLAPPVGRDAPDLRARQLMIVIQMISEAARFTAVADEFIGNWQTGQVPSDRTLALENNWGALSSELLHADRNPDHRLALPTDTDLRVNSLADILLVLGILLRRNMFVPGNGGGGSNKFRREAKMEASKRQEKGLILPGRQLVEVFHTVVNNIDGENPGDLYGRITATDGAKSYYLFSRDRESSESVGPGGYPTLIGPDRCISAADDWQFEFDLMDKDKDLSPDDEVAKGTIMWSPYNWRTAVYDKAVSTNIGGKFGNVGIVYSVMSNAAEALLEIVLINGDGEDPADVYGNIKSQTTAYDNEIVLFNKEKKEHIGVKPGQNIPLLRKAVAVPVDATLKITADLTDHDADISPDDEIAKGIAEFKPEIQKSSTQRIKGKHGEIEVRISWL